MSASVALASASARSMLRQHCSACGGAPWGCSHVAQSKPWCWRRRSIAVDHRTVGEADLRPRRASRSLTRSGRAHAARPSTTRFVGVQRRQAAGVQNSTRSLADLAAPRQPIRPSHHLAGVDRSSSRPRCAPQSCNCLHRGCIGHEYFGCQKPPTQCTGLGGHREAQAQVVDHGLCLLEHPAAPAAGRGSRRCR